MLHLEALFLGSLAPFLEHPLKRAKVELVLFFLLQLKLLLADLLARLALLQCFVRSLIFFEEFVNVLKQVLDYPVLFCLPLWMASPEVVGFDPLDFPFFLLFHLAKQVILCLSQDSVKGLLELSHKIWPIKNELGIFVNFFGQPAEIYERVELVLLLVVFRVHLAGGEENLSIELHKHLDLVVVFLAYTSPLKDFIRHL